MVGKDEQVPDLGLSFPHTHISIAQLSLGNKCQVQTHLLKLAMVRVILATAPFFCKLKF